MEIEGISLADICIILHNVNHTYHLEFMQSEPTAYVVSVLKNSYDGFLL